MGSFVRTRPRFVSSHQESTLSAAGEPLIRIEGLHYSYQAGTRQPIAALRGVDLAIGAGEYVAVIGANGSGKSTLLRHLNALLLPTQGNVWVHEWNTRHAPDLRHIRSTVAMVFQNPDSQIVASTVEEDVAFGPENLGVPEPELRQRVEWALAVVDLTDLRQHASHLLSAGQKQRLAIAAALAMRPQCLLFDEATAMLDPAGRLRVLDTMRALHHDGMTVVTATHHMGEAAQAQRIVVLSAGQVVLQGEPRFIFSQEEALQALQLDVPYPTRLARAIAARVAGFPNDTLTVAEVVNAIVARSGPARVSPATGTPPRGVRGVGPAKALEP
jgi:energy-coupling factor transporter ATPase